MPKYRATIVKKVSGEEHPMSFEVKPDVRIGEIIDLEKMLNRFAASGIEFEVNANIDDEPDDESQFPVDHDDEDRLAAQSERIQDVIDERRHEFGEPSGDLLDQGDRNG